MKAGEWGYRRARDAGRKVSDAHKQVSCIGQWSGHLGRELACKLAL